MTSLAPPQNAAPLDARGQMSQPWTQFLARMAREVDALASAPGQWEVGDIRQTLLALGQDWLRCDGTEASRKDYPALSALLPIGQAPGTFTLPFVPGFYDAGSANGVVQPHWIRGR